MKLPEITTHTEWQTLLSEEGFYKAKIDGIWGPISRRAISDYCESLDLTHIRVNRNKSDETTTLSEVFISGKFICHFLEDAHHETKIKGRTRIDGGTYQLGVRKRGGFHARYKKLFPWHKGMLHVLRVPKFKYILHHIGNSHEDTAGCSLIGRGIYSIMYLSTSRVTYQKYYNAVIGDALKNKTLITYEDNDQ